VTAVAEQKKTKKKVDTEVPDNGTSVITVEDAAAAEDQSVPAPSTTPGEPGYDWAIRLWCSPPKTAPPSA
jgi:hypothetical protein